MPNDRLLITMLGLNSDVSLTMLTRDGALDTGFANGGTFTHPDVIYCGGSDKINNAAKLIGGNLYVSACHDNAVTNPDHSANQDFGVARYRYEIPIFQSGFEAGG